MNNQTAYLIKERAPEFPCWIWLDKGDDVLGEWLWFAHEVDYHRAVKCWRLTHWCGQSQMPTTYPDQPTAPMLAPDAPKVRLKTKEEFIRVIAPDAPKETPALDAFQQPDATIPHTISVSTEGAGPSTAPQAGTPTPDPYAYEYATTPKEKELYSAIASGFSTKGMLYDDEMKEAIFGMVRPALTMWERELADLTAERDVLKNELVELGSEQGRVHDVLLTVDEVPHYDDKGVRGIDEQVKDLAGLYRQLQKNCLQAFDLMKNAEAETTQLRSSLATAKQKVGELQRALEGRK